MHQFLIFEVSVFRFGVDLQVCMQSCAWHRKHGTGSLLSVALVVWFRTGLHANLQIQTKRRKRRRTFETLPIMYIPMLACSHGKETVLRIPAPTLTVTESKIFVPGGMVGMMSPTFFTRSRAYSHVGSIPWIVRCYTVPPLRYGFGTRRGFILFMRPLFLLFGF